MAINHLEVQFNFTNFPDVWWKKDVTNNSVYRPRSVQLQNAAKENPFFLEKSEPMKHGCRVLKDDERRSQWEDRYGKHKAKKRMQLMRVKQILAMREARRARVLDR